MIKKDRLIQDVDRLIELKQRFTIILEKCIATSFNFRTGVDSERQRVDHVFEEFVHMQKRHHELLSEIKNDIEQVDQDVY